MTDWTTDWTAQAVVEATRGRLFGEAFCAKRVITDSRAVQAGDLFVALNGENFQGVRFVEQARARGAVAVVVEHYQADCALSQVVVEDTLLALGQLAHARRMQSTAKVLAITGTNGKTSSKEMLKAILSAKGQTLATQGNFNNAVGMPLTLLQLMPAHEFVVLEMGANHAGEIAYLCDLARPEAVAVTNVSEAHLAGFGDYAAVVRAKEEIYAHSAGVMVVNLDLPCAPRWLERFSGREVVRFSLQEKAEIYASEIQDNGRVFTLWVNGVPFAVQWQLEGVHNISNALTACALAYAVGVSGEKMAVALSGLTFKQARLSAYEFGVHRVYDDTYNANPASFKAGIEVIKTAKNALVIAGDMGELGEHAAYLHAQVGAYARECGVAGFWCVGAFAKDYGRGFGEKAREFANQQDLAVALAQLLQHQQPYTVLVKGSRSAKMERVLALAGLDFSDKAGK